MMANVMRNGVIGATLAVIMLPLAGCGSKQDAASDQATATASEKSADDVKTAAGKLERPRPGAYKQTMEIVDMQIMGMPAAAAAQMKGMIGQTQTHTICITEADADKGYKDMLNNVGKGTCTYTKFDVAGGRLDAQMQCSTPGQGESTMTMNGTVGESGSNIVVGMNTKGGQAPMGNMSMKMHLTTQRVGDCTS